MAIVELNPVATIGAQRSWAEMLAVAVSRLKHIGRRNKAERILEELDDRQLRDVGVERREVGDLVRRASARSELVLLGVPPRRG